MEHHYRIAGLTVAMDTFGKTARQAQPYAIAHEEKVDIRVQPDKSIWKRRYPGIPEDDCEYMASGRSFYEQLLNFQGTVLHSSAVVVDGRAYLFSAPSGTGKSTHTQLWMKLFGDRAYILNDDKPALRLENGVWYAYGTPWSGKHDISVNTRVPLAGIAKIERGEVNEITPWTGYEVLNTLMKQVVRPKNIESQLILLDLLDKLISRVSVWKLRCNMEDEAAIVSYEAMSGERYVATICEENSDEQK